MRHLRDVQSETELETGEEVSSYSSGGISVGLFVRGWRPAGEELWNRSRGEDGEEGQRGEGERCRLTGIDGVVAWDVAGAD